MTATDQRSTPVRPRPWLQVIERHYLLALGAGTFLLYVLTKPMNRMETGDGYAYATAVEEGGNLVSPRFALYLPLMRIAYRAVSEVAPSVRAHSVLATVSVVAAVMTVCLVAWTLHERLRQPRSVAIAAATLLAFSSGFWLYATEAEIYALAILLAMLSVVLAFRGDAGGRDLALSSLVGVLAILVHTVNVIPVLAAIPLGLWKHRNFSAAALYAAATGGAVVAAAGVLFLFNEVNFGNVTDRDTYAGLSSYLTSLTGVGEVIISGNFLFAHEPLQRFMAMAFPSRSFVDQIYMGSRAPAISAYLAPLTALLVVLAGVWTIALAIGNRNPDVPRWEGLTVAIVSWLGGMTLVGVIMSAGNPEGWLTALPPAALSAGIWVLPRVRISSRIALALLPSALLLHNLLGGVLMIGSEDGDFYRARTSLVIAEAEPGDIVIAAMNYGGISFLRYHADAEIYDASKTTADDLSDVVDAAAGRRVLVTGDVLAPPSSVDASRDEIREMQAFASRYQDRMKLLSRDSLADVYVLR